jgi:hypothetical protein
MFTPYIISKEHVAAHSVKRKEQKRNKQTKASFVRSETFVSTMSDDSAASVGVRFTPYILSKWHLAACSFEPKERETIKEIRTYKRRGTDVSIMSDRSAASVGAKFTPYIISKRHVAAHST